MAMINPKFPLRGWGWGRVSLGILLFTWVCSGACPNGIRTRVEVRDLTPPQVEALRMGYRKLLEERVIEQFVTVHLQNIERFHK
jgi:hypothetical protein